MCGRYHIDAFIMEELKKILKGLDCPWSHIEGMDVYPSQTVPVLIPGEAGVTAEVMEWGFPNYRGNGRVINARAETIFEKPMFALSAKYHRCIVPARGFYEWNNSKDKGFFTNENEEPLCMAGLYGMFQEQRCFVIVTTAANPSIRDVHGRMPYILRRGQIMDWLYSREKAAEILSQEPDPLCRSFEYFQESFQFE